MATASIKKEHATRLIDAKSAVHVALNYLHHLLSNLSVTDITFEELEHSKDGRYWHVTLGYSEKRQKNQLLPEYLQVPLRKMKIVIVDAITGEVKSIKNREG